MDGKNWEVLSKAQSKTFFNDRSQRNTIKRIENMLDIFEAMHAFKDHRESSQSETNRFEKVWIEARRHIEGTKVCKMQIFKIASRLDLGTRFGFFVGSGCRCFF